MLPPGYRWQEEVFGPADGTPEIIQTTALDVNMPPVQFGRTLVFRMIKPSDWDTLDQRAKFLKKRKHLCERYGDLCFTFLEDPDALRNELGRIIVAPNDYYALFEVHNLANVEKQYRASMILLENGLGMKLDSFLELKRTLGVRWTKPITSSKKRPRDEGTSQTPISESNGEAGPSNKVKRVRLQEPTPVPEPEQEPRPRPRPSPFASLSLFDKHKISRCLFPAACMASNAAKYATRKPCTFRPFTTIRRTEFAKRLQVLQPSPQVQVARFRLCHSYGQGKRDAVQAECGHREIVVSDFDNIIQACTRFGPFCGLETDKVIEILAHCIRCEGHPDLASDEFVKANTALKWAFLYMAHLKNMITWAKAKISVVDWATRWEEDLSARIELFQHVQEQAWLRFYRAATHYKQVMMARLSL